MFDPLHCIVEPQTGAATRGSFDRLTRSHDNQAPDPLPMRTTVIVLILFATLSSGRQLPDAELPARLQSLFPSATSFSPKEGNPPHFKAFIDGEGSAPSLIGFAFYTTDLEPLERGYDGPIQILVGMDTTSVLTRIIVVAHNEPYGYFSVDRPEYAAQFVGKSIRERFRVGDDIDAVSTATLTVTSSTRAVRNGARRMARQFLRPEDLR